MDRKGIVIFLVMIIASTAFGQVKSVVPDIVTLESPQSIQFWEGTQWGVRQMVGMNVTGSQIIFNDNSSTNEGRLTLAGNSSNGSVVLSSNTSTSTPIKIIGRGNVSVTAHTDTIRIDGSLSGGYLFNSGALTVNNGTLTSISNLSPEVEDDLNIGFEIYVMYTTGSTSQGIKFRIEPNVPERGTYWYTFDFPTTTTRLTGAVYNANTTITTDSSTSGTNIGVIRGIARSAGVGAGILTMQFQIAAEDGSSTVSVLSTSAIRGY